MSKERQISVRKRAELSEQFRNLGGTKDSEQNDQLLILMAILYGLTENTWSGDVMKLSIYRAKDICESLDIPEDKVNEILKKFGQFAKAMRDSNPMANAFFGKDQ